jgi:hypothetical protein
VHRNKPEHWYSLWGVCDAQRQRVPDAWWWLATGPSSANERLAQAELERGLHADIKRLGLDRNDWCQIPLDPKEVLSEKMFRSYAYTGVLDAGAGELDLDAQGL